MTILVRTLAFASLVSGLFLGAGHPVWPMVQCLAVAICFAVTLSVPFAWPFLFPLLLVIGDAYPFTGQLLVQEYDSLLFGSFAGWAARSCREVAKGEDRETITNGRDAKLIWMWGPWILLSLSIIVAMAIGFHRLPSAPWGDQLSVYFTDQNALRIAKGYGWGILFAVCFLLIRPQEIRARFGRSLVGGIQTSIAYVGGCILLERWLFESLFDFTREFRASGPFFTMHVGDQHVDAFIALATPFAWASSNSTSWSRRLIIGLGLSWLMLYAALATMSRATIAAVSVEILLLGCLMCVGNRAPIWKGSTGRIAWLALACLVIIGVILVVLNGNALRKRFENVSADWNGRIDHWQKSFESNDRNWTDRIFGNGMGTFPTMMASKMNRKIPPLRWRPDRGGAIEMAVGWPIYLECIQWPATKTTERLQLATEPVNNQAIGDGVLQFYRCFKSIFHSYEMTQKSVVLDTVEARAFVELDPPRLSADAPFQRVWRPETIGISVSGPADIFIRNLDKETNAKTSIANRHKISNKGSAPWCFTCDDHLVWRAKNAGVHLFYEHGILGLLAAFAIAVRLIAPNAIHIDGSSRQKWNIALISIAGFSVVAFFGTLIDTPWIVALVLAVCVYAQASREYNGTGPQES